MNEFEAQVNSLISKYGQYLECDLSVKMKLFSDFIEAREDIKRIGPLITAIGDGTLPKEKCYRALLLIMACGWHLSDHLSSISTIIQDTDLLSDGDQ